MPNWGTIGLVDSSRALRVLSVGSLPPEWGGPSFGGVATAHATLLKGFADATCPVEVVGVAAAVTAGGDTPAVPVFTRPEGVTVAAFYERLLDELQPDAVVMHHFAHAIGVTHARLPAPPPAVGVAHSWNSVTARSGSDRQAALERAAEALSGLSALVGPSRHCLREGRELGLDYPPLVETIHHPVRASLAGDGIDVGGERGGVLYLGALAPPKQPDVLVEAAAALPGVAVHLGGAGELEPELRARIAGLAIGDRVEIGPLDANEVRDRLLGAETMCLPSASESLGLAYVEALACGTPVVGFAPTLREIGDAVGGAIGEPLDSAEPAAVAAAIERVRATRWDRAQLRRRTLAAFGLERAVGRYVDLLERVAARPAARI